MALTARKSYRYFSDAGDESLNSNSLDVGDQFELDETEVLSNNDIVLPEITRENVYNHRRLPVRIKPLRESDDRLPVGPKSLPVNIPDWSRILGLGHGPRDVGNGEGVCEEEGDCGNDIIPPHEYLARNRAASLSVHEGMGRTLKGRDLSRVRNAIWKKTGFVD